jgi:hypothetical protein
VFAGNTVLVGCHIGTTTETYDDLYNACEALSKSSLGKASNDNLIKFEKLPIPDYAMKIE